MLFNSYPFLLIFLPLALLTMWIADHHPKARVPVLIALSFAFYGHWDIRFVPLLAGSIIVNWCAAALYVKTRQSTIVVAAICVNLAVLGLFKYANFLSGSATALLGTPSMQMEWALPLGISFFTFHHIMYLVDLRRGAAPPFPIDRYALYICFFPQVLAGPLVRWHEIMHQFGHAAFGPGWQRRFAFGVIFIVIGLAQKVLLGDELADIVNPVYERAVNTGTLGRNEAWLAVLGFSFQIFFDFSGYTDIAIGLALLLGIELPRNFNAPYRALSVQDFWRRWHMTLSRFLRDYLYIPLGGNRHGLTRQIGALLATMFLGGLWHGAGWTFVVWGLLHGIALAAELLGRRWGIRLPMLVAWFATFMFITLAWVFFRSPSFATAQLVLQSLFVGDAGFPQTGWRSVSIAAFCAIALPSTYEVCRRLAERPRTWVALLMSGTAVTILVGLGSDRFHEFIYFRF